MSTPTATKPATKLDIYRRCASLPQFKKARPWSCPLFKSVAHDVSQYRAYRKRNGQSVNADVAYIRIREDAVAAAAAAATDGTALAADTRDDQLRWLRTRVRVLEDDRDEQTRRKECKQQELNIAEENLAYAADEIRRLNALLHEHGYELPYEVPASQRCLCTFLRVGHSSSKGAQERECKCKRKRKRLRV